MYAARRLYVQQWEHQKPEERYNVTITKGGKPIPGIQASRISTVEEEVMYWRKANHIHAWFVDNVQGGTDDQQSYHVKWDKLRELLTACEAVIKASKLVDGKVISYIVWDSDTKADVAVREPGKVIEDPRVAQTLLPTREGFFFGTCEYDEDYLNDVVRTRDWAVSMLADHEAGVPGDIYYSCWW
jgi:hypothetical protein